MGIRKGAENCTLLSVSHGVVYSQLVITVNQKNSLAALKKKKKKACLEVVRSFWNYSPHQFHILNNKVNQRRFCP